MKIRSLLLGSAAAMVAVSGAQAADAIVVEPEPVEYVRVCDAYGTGFFYIPGTETCIRFSGYVRSTYQKAYLDGTNIDLNGITRAALNPNGAGTITTGAGGVVADPNFTFWGQRARLNIDTRNETDWGTLRAQYRLEGGDSNTDADIDMDRALISLAGFRAGFTDNYWSTNHGYGGVNFEDVGGVAGGLFTEGGWYGFDDATIFDYTWAGDGFSVTVGVEDPRISYSNGFFNATNAGGADGRANFYAGFNYSASWGGVAFTAAHDSLAPEIAAAGLTGDVGGWAWKGSLSLNLSEWVPGGVLHGWYMTDGDHNTDYVHNNTILQNPEDIWAINFQMNLTEELQFLAGYSSADGGFADSDSRSGAANFTTANEGDATQWSVGLNWYPAAAPGFSVRTAYMNGEVTRSYGSFHADNTGGAVAGTSYDYSAWTITVRRDF